MWQGEGDFGYVSSELVMALYNIAQKELWINNSKYGLIND